MKTPKKRYQEQKDAAKQRGIEFLLTFEEWWNIWEQSGKWEQRGCRRGQYVMSRVNDTGPYQVGNVFIQTCSGNNSDAHKGRPKPKSRFPMHHNGGNKSPKSLEWRLNQSLKMRGRKQPTKVCESCGINISVNNYGRHIVKCVG